MVPSVNLQACVKRRHSFAPLVYFVDGMTAKEARAFSLQDELQEQYLILAAKVALPPPQREWGLRHGQARAPSPLPPRWS